MEKLVFLVFLLTFSPSLGLDLWSGVFGSADKDGAEDAGIVDTLKRALYDGSGEAEGQYPEEVANYIKASTDPEVNMGPKELIEYWGYPAEEYEVLAADGFLLTAQRIPGGRHDDAFTTATQKPVIFLMHGLLDSAAAFISNLPNQSLAFILADAGFDVWLGNARGNTYSRDHTQYKPEDVNFWKFSWDEIAEYDMPAFIDFVLSKTNHKQIYYAGHSQGSMVIFAKASEDLEFGKKIKMFFALGPVTTMGKIKGPVSKLPWINGLLSVMTSLFGVREFLPKSSFVDWFAKKYCHSSTKFLCTNILFVIAGSDTAQLNETRLPVYLTHTPSGTSVQNIIHYGQSIHHGKFQKYDFGYMGNIWHYGSYQAPLYDVTKMEVPTVLFYGGKDTLADPDDVQMLIPKIKNLHGSFLNPDLDHLDYVWGLTSAAEVYHPIINIIQKEEQKNLI